ncbi:facilitated trehalose transporter Tret1-like isoform X1 [Colias croceus]|uniref:facilitated trehalose transporter Tret1-like isoform X1 n=2 Tax=Colias crocea TaxID=72248 RepID=UPI001E27E123|nr:facilitated trehalose transporter Tret1-like isoform X1 [Colias croceus]
MKLQIENKIMEKNGHTYLQWIVASIVNIGSLIYGLEVGWISPITKTLQSESSPLGYPLSDSVMAWVASSSCFAAAFGVSIYSYLSDQYGRKLAIQAVIIPQMLSVCLRLISPTITALLIARILAGLAAGGVYIVVPMYLKEISQESMTGILVSLQVLFQNLGILAMYIIGIYLDYYTILWLSTILPVVALLLLLKVPESPAYLVKQEKVDTAYHVVALLRGLECHDKRVESELEYMQRQESEFKAIPNVSLLTLFKEKAWRRGIIFGLILFSIQAWNGAYAIITYASPILASTGVKFDISPEYQSISFPIVMVSANCALTLVVEKYGRKTLLIVAFLISAIAMISLSAAMIFRLYGGTVPSWLPVISMMLSASMYSGGICPLSFLVTTELFNFQIRAKVMGLVFSYAWVAFFIPLVAYAPVTNAFGQHITFLIFGIMNVIGAFFTLAFIPETKGRSNEEIKKALTGK